VSGDDVSAVAILDHLLHHSHTMVIQGESYRLKQKRKAGLLGNPITRPRSRGRSPTGRLALIGKPMVGTGTRLQR
jgi:hypothetical protein